MIRDWLESAVGDVLDASDGTELRVNCPFCKARIGKPDVKYHMYISIESPVAFCFRCNWQGNYIGLVMSVSGCSYSEALKQMESPKPNVRKFETLFSPMGLVMGHQMSAMPSGFRFFTSHDDSMGMEERAVWNYLVHKRKLSKFIVRKYMGWSPGTRRAWLLIDNNYWQGRLIMPGEPKYMSSPWPKGDALWNPNALNDNHIYICEGVFSALAVGSHAIALCGKTITTPQAKRIVQSSPPAITIMLDADATQFSYDIAETLEKHGYVGRLKIHELDKGDPTDGLEGRGVDYGWGALVHNRIRTTV